MKLPVDRSFPAFLSRNNEDGENIRSAQVLKQEAEDIGYEGKEILEYVKQQQALDRKERAAWRDAQKMQAQADIELAKIGAEAEAEEKTRAQAQASTGATVDSPPGNRNAKSPKLPAVIDKKDELNSYLLRFECWAENASWEKNTWAIKLSVLLTGRAMDVYTRMSDDDAKELKS